MQFAVDIGNSRVKIGLFDGPELIDTILLEELSAEALNALISGKGVDHVILSSVSRKRIPGDMVSAAGLVLELTHATSLPIGVDYSTPETLGLDRIAAAVGASIEFPGSNVLVIDAGTCITYDVVKGSAGFAGGNIAPGVDMRLKAMHQFTGRLPSVARGEVARILGDNTHEAMLNGAVIGVLMEIEGYIKALGDRYNELVAVLTGGDALYLSEKLKTEIFVRPNLVLKGLNEILLFNVAKS